MLRSHVYATGSYSSLFVSYLGFGPAVGAEMLSLMLIGGIISRLINGMLADKLGGVYTLLIGSTLQCIALFLYLPFDGLVSLYIVSLVFGLSQGGIVPSYAIIIRELFAWSRCRYSRWLCYDVHNNGNGYRWMDVRLDL